MSGAEELRRGAIAEATGRAWFGPRLATNPGTTAVAYDVMVETIERWFEEHQHTRQRDVPARLTENVLRALSEHSLVVARRLS